MPAAAAQMPISPLLQVGSSFDIHTLVCLLEENGFTTQQAEIIVICTGQDHKGQHGSQLQRHGEDTTGDHSLANNVSDC